MTELDYEGSVYAVQCSPQDLYSKKPKILLPSGEQIKIAMWYPTKTPSPSKAVLVEAEDKFDLEVSALFLRRSTLMPDKGSLNASVVTQKADRNQRLKFEITVSLEDMLIHTRRGFLSMLELYVLNDSVKGNFRDPRYKVVSHTEQSITLEVDVDVSSITNVRVRKDVDKPCVYRYP